MKEIERDNTFDVYMALGLIVKGDVDELRQLIEQIQDNPKLILVFTKSSAGRLKIVDD